MPGYHEFLEGVVARGELVNTMFEERLFSLAAVLRLVSEGFTVAGIEHEVIGGLAVLIHVEEADPEYSTLTRDVDLMIHRRDLDRIKTAAEDIKFRYRHVAGVDMLAPLEGPTRGRAVHLIFSGEKVRPEYLAETPSIRPQMKRILGVEVPVIQVPELLLMKLTSFRDKDRVHVRSLDDAGLISADAESQLAPELTARLKTIRETE